MFVFVDIIVHYMAFPLKTTTLPRVLSLVCFSHSSCDKKHNQNLQQSPSFIFKCGFLTDVAHYKCQSKRKDINTLQQVISFLYPTSFIFNSGAPQEHQGCFKLGSKITALL